MTNYTVLKYDQQLEAWKEVAQVQADNAERAERGVVADNGEGIYVAIPDRSWKPSSYESKTQIVRSSMAALEDAGIA